MYFLLHYNICHNKCYTIFQFLLHYKSNLKQGSCDRIFYNFIFHGIADTEKECFQLNVWTCCGIFLTHTGLYMALGTLRNGLALIGSTDCENNNTACVPRASSMCLDQKLCHCVQTTNKNLSDSFKMLPNCMLFYS